MRWPFVFVGGWAGKVFNLIRALGQLLFFQFQNSACAFSESGSPIVAAQIMEQPSFSGSEIVHTMRKLCGLEWIETDPQIADTGEADSSKAA